MKLLLCCEFYHPSRGGVQEVMRQLAERFAADGHDVTVATTRLHERSFRTLNGVKIEEFDIAGNIVRGLEGELERYQTFLTAFDGDAILIKAAQQWTFDASWPVLDRISTRKVFIPCGFSCLFEPSYQQYFQDLPPILAKFDSLIFYAEEYRDVSFARRHGLKNLEFLPNGASEKEFGSPPSPGIRERLGISDDAFILLTVGTPINAKGHTEAVRALALLEQQERPMVLLLNGQWPKPPPPPESFLEPVVESAGDTPQRADLAIRDVGLVARALDTWRRGGAVAFLRRGAAWLYYRMRWAVGLVLAPLVHFVREAIYRVHMRLHATFTPKAPLPQPPPRTIDDYIAEAEALPGRMVLKTNLDRHDLIELFFAADLFVFASNVEYSPLVLFEACAAGLPFLTVPVGNAEEIVRWTGGGVVCPADKDERGYTRSDPAVLADHIRHLMADDAARRALGDAGRAAWMERYTWSAISRTYLRILEGKGQSADMP